MSHKLPPDFWSDERISQFEQFVADMQSGDTYRKPIFADRNFYRGWKKEGYAFGTRARMSIYVPKTSEWIFSTNGYH
uniref:Uncharacterized protein n=1 Tax=Marseillevirus LCMAC102 TaxID=2506603 RepID=A0A481YT84_9VIRU|nr:MAG: hypothetical protein LCMAC102_02980 [Marseillevirus LCMAC102]